jgi:hypothetical protein
VNKISKKMNELRRKLKKKPKDESTVGETLQKEVTRVGKTSIKIWHIILVVGILVPILIVSGIGAFFIQQYLGFAFQPPPPAKIESGWGVIQIKDAYTGNDLGTLNIDLYFRSNETYYKTVATKTTFYLDTYSYAYINITAYNPVTISVQVNESSSTPNPNTIFLMRSANYSQMSVLCIRINGTFGSYGLSAFSSANYYIADFILSNTNVSTSWGDVYYTPNGTLKTTSQAYIQQIKRGGGWFCINTTGTVSNVFMDSTNMTENLIHISNSWIFPIFPITFSYGIKVKFDLSASATAIYIFEGIIDNLFNETQAIPP